MALIGRIFVVLAASLVASFAAVMVMATGMLLPYDWHNLHPADIQHGMVAMVTGFGFFVISAQALLPAMIIVAVAEAFRLRAALFYAAAGGLAGMVLFYQGSFHEGTPHDPPMTRMAEIMAAAGIVGGLLYWAMAGRNAGKWSERRTPAAPPPA